MKNIIKQIISLIVILSVFFTEGYAQHFQGSLWANSGGNYTNWKTFVTDVSGDGKADIVCWRANPARIQVFKAKEQANGFNSPTTWYNSSSNYSGWQIYLADVSGDRKTDIILWSPTAAKAIVIRSREESDGFYPGAVWVDSPGNYSGWKTFLADFSGDGKADLLEWNAAKTKAVVWVSKEQGNAFYPGTVWADGPEENFYNGWKWHTYVAEVSGDNKADIILWGATYEKAIVLRAKEEQNGFYPESTWVDGPGNSYAPKNTFTLADVTGDGRADLVRWTAAWEYSTVYKSKEDGYGYGFTSQITWYDGPSNIDDPVNKYYFTDVNGDGKADLLRWVPSLAYATVYISKRIGEGYGFKPPVSWVDDPGNYKNWKTYVADVNGDGRADILCWYPAKGKAQVWIVKD